METVTNIPVEGFNLVAKIIYLRLDNFFLTNITSEEIKNIDKDKITFEFNVQCSISIPDKKVSIILLSKIFKEEAKTNYLGEMNTSGEFRVENIEEIIKKFNGIPQVVIGTFIGIVLGTSRGMFIFKSEGTYLNGVMVPVVNIASFFIPPKQTAAVKA